MGKINFYQNKMILGKEYMNLHLPFSSFTSPTLQKGDTPRGVEWHDEIKLI